MHKTLALRVKGRAPGLDVAAVVAAKPARKLAPDARRVGDARGLWCSGHVPAQTISRAHLLVAGAAHLTGAVVVLRKGARIVDGRARQARRHVAKFDAAGACIGRFKILRIDDA